MKNSIKIFTSLIVTALIFIGIACQPQHEQQMTEHMDADEHYSEDSIPLIYHMSFIQRYATKLYFSGMEENWGLADIYAHELEEISEVIVDGNHMDDGVDVSTLMESMLPPQIESIEEAIDAQDRAMFEERYQTMIQTCNQCHQASDYGLVKVTVPETNPFAQDFSAE
ncbi:MAG: hypothetical protein CL666_00725 [Balneola sp.]|nr:hypothetical protein [Balneola sp.]|tara:strand:- start:11111 stop:11614 length:504 start_codon:yes stop_codon:yes gene_type:complete